MYGCLYYPLTESLDTIECTDREQRLGFYFVHEQDYLNLRIFLVFKDTFSLEASQMDEITDFAYAQDNLKYQHILTEGGEGVSLTLCCFVVYSTRRYVFPCVILFLCFSILLVLRLPRLGKRELILVLFVCLFDLCLFGFVGFLFLLGSGKGCGL